MKVGGFDASKASHFNPYHMMMAGMPYMIEQARAAANSQAYSYRGFHVGVAAFAIAGKETMIFNGGNIKAKQSKPKFCGELVVTGQAKKKKCEAILGMVVAATTDIDKIEAVTGVRTPTLHLCEECLDPNGKVAGSSLMNGNTLIITTGIENDTLQAHTLQELQTAYANGVGDTLVEARSGMDWTRATATFDYLHSQNRQQNPELQQAEAVLAKTALMLAGYL